MSDERDVIYRPLDTTAFRDPTITRRDDGSLTLDWADGLVATSISREVIEGLVDGHNATLAMLRRLVDAPVYGDDGGCAWCGWVDDGEMVEPDDCPWVAARRALGMEP